MDKRHAFVFIAVVGLGAITTSQVFAVKEFDAEFKKMYVPPDPTDPNQKAFKAAVDKAKCNVCHVGTKKTDRNAYGQELDKLLNRKTDAKAPNKIQAALKQVEGMRSKPDDNKSPTFGERIKAGKLPGE